MATTDLLNMAATDQFLRGTKHSDALLFHRVHCSLCFHTATAKVMLSYSYFNRLSFELDFESDHGQHCQKN